MIDYRLKFAKLILQINSEREIKIDDSLLPFLDYSDGRPDVRVYLSWSWKSAIIPEKECLGEDSINRYYESDGICYCVTKGGDKGELACTVYDKTLQELKCYINIESFVSPPKSMISFLKMIPIKEIFVQYGILLFHASQISYKGKGIMFIAPSGTGKTTQAKLWKKYRNAEIICNDRTLVREKDGIWYTYGYPFDGSEPVRSSAVNELGCMVFLCQSKENRVERFNVAKATANLMSQLALDKWSSDERMKAMELLLSLIEKRPVFLLNCTKDEDAVVALEKILIESRIIDDGESKR